MPSLRSALKLFFFIISAVILVFIGLVLTVYFFPEPIAKRIAPYYLGNDAQISCLEMELGLNSTVNVPKLCLDYPNAKVVIHNAHFEVLDWSAQKSALDIELLSITHLDSQADKDEPENSPIFDADFSFTLPDNLPSVAISALTVDSYLLGSPINVQVNMATTKQIQITGDVNGNVDMQEGGGLLVQIDWTIGRVLDHSVYAKNLLADYQSTLDWATLRDSPIHSEMQLKGAQLSMLHQLNIDNQVNLSACSIPFTLVGKIGVQLDLAALSAVLELSDLSPIIDPSQCSNGFEALPVAPLELAFEPAWQVDKQGLSVPKVKVMSLNLADAMALHFTDITVNFIGELNARYLLQASMPLDTLSIQGLPLVGQLKLDSAGEISANQHGFELTLANSDIQLDEVRLQNNDAKSVHMQFDGNLLGDVDGWHLHADMQQQVRNIHVADKGSIHSINSSFVVDGDPLEEIGIQVTSTLNRLEYAQNHVKSIQAQFDMQLTSLDKLRLQGNSALTAVSGAGFKIDKMTFNHELTNQFKQSGWVGTHEFALPSGLIGYVFHASSKLRLSVPEQPVKTIQKYVRQVDSNVNLVEGSLALSIESSDTPQVFNGELALNQVSLEYKDYMLLHMNMAESFVIDSAGLQLARGIVNAEEINVGVPMTQVQATLSVNNNAAKIEYASAQVMGGTFSVSDFWLDNRAQVSNLKISGLDLSKVSKLQNQEGIEVTGEVSGHLPIRLSSNLPIIEDGLLTSDGPGKLQIKNNAAFDSIKAEQKQLAFLENVEFEKLSSEVSLAPDGWMDLQLSIAGKNPDRNQEVIFNYNHKENIFTLLEALRVTNSIQNVIEKRIEKKLTQQGNQQ